MKTIKVENCHTCPYIARKPYNCWYCGKTGITIDDIEGIHPDCPLPDHFADATEKVESDHSVEANKMIRYGCAHPEKDNGDCPFNENTDECVGCRHRTVESEPSEAGNSSKSLRVDPVKLIKWARAEIKEYENLIETLGGKP